MRLAFVHARVKIGDIGGTHAGSPVSFRRLILNAEGACTPYPAVCFTTSTACCGLLVMVVLLLLLLLDST